MTSAEINRLATEFVDDSYESDSGQRQFQFGFDDNKTPIVDEWLPAVIEGILTEVNTSDLVRWLIGLSEALGSAQLSPDELWELSEAIARAARIRDFNAAELTS